MNETGRTALEREAITEQERYFVATQWQLMWRKFRKHKSALAGGVIGYNAGYKNRDRAALVGAMIGGVIGHEIGEDMDREEALRRQYDRGGYYEYDR